MLPTDPTFYGNQTLSKYIHLVGAQDPVGYTRDGVLGSKSINLSRPESHRPARRFWYFFFYCI